MKTMGLTDLVVVNGPNGFQTHQQAIMLGHGAGDVLEKARVVTTWEEATDGLHWLVGTTHRKRRAQFPQIIEARQAAAKIAELSHKHRVGIVFGREEAGLSDMELRLCHDIVSVPQASEHPSLNLAQAVMLFAYEVYLASLGEIPKPRTIWPRSTRSSRCWIIWQHHSTRLAFGRIRVIRIHFCAPCAA